MYEKICNKKYIIVLGFRVFQTLKRIHLAFILKAFVVSSVILVSFAVRPSNIVKYL